MTMEVPELRWGENRRVDSDFAREQILDAAMRCYQQTTFHKTRMEHIAREAKVSRTTIYRYFENRDDVLMGVILRAVRELMKIVSQRVAATVTFADFIVETIAITLDHVPHLPLFKIMMTEATAVVSHVHVNNIELFEIAAMHFKPRFDMAAEAGELRDDVEFEQFMEWIIHIGATLVLMPPTRYDEKQIRQILWRYLVRSIVRDETTHASKCK